jgi:hypothetical protein
VFTCPASGAFNCIDTYEDNMGAPFWRNVSCY